MSIPTDYKTLAEQVPCVFTQSWVAYFAPIKAFENTPFAPYVYAAGPTYYYHCPGCGNECEVTEICGGEYYVIWCEDCGFTELTPDEVAITRLDIHALIRGIATAHGFDCEQIGNYWNFGTQLLGGKYRNVFFMPSPNTNDLQSLLANTGSILLCFNAKCDDKAKYPFQLYTLAELQNTSEHLTLNLEKIGEIVADKPKVTVKRSSRKDERTLQEKKLITLLDQEIRHYQQCLLPGNKKLLDAYKLPTYRSLAKRLTLEGEKISHMTIGNLIKSGESLELKLLYTILQQPERVKCYKGLAHARAVLSVH